MGFMVKSKSSSQRKCYGENQRLISKWMPQILILCFSGFPYICLLLMQLWQVYDKRCWDWMEYPSELGMWVWSKKESTLKSKLLWVSSVPVWSVLVCPISTFTHWSIQVNERAATILLLSLLTCNTSSHSQCCFQSEGKTYPLSILKGTAYEQLS